VAQVEELCHPRKSLKGSINNYAEASIRKTPKFIDAKRTIKNDNRPVEVVLESALHSLGRCIDLVRPAGLLVSSVSKKDWVMALNTLEHSISEIHAVCDPDRPLRPSEWGKLVDEDKSMLEIEHTPVLDRKDTIISSDNEFESDLSFFSQHD
jgi:hypothetical protein